MPTQEVNLLQLYKESAGVYKSKDDRFKIQKEGSTWSWFIRSGSEWIAKDKRKYQTKSKCEKCVLQEMDNFHDDSELWEG
jgi:hypothetical protein